MIGLKLPRLSRTHRDNRAKPGAMAQPWADHHYRPTLNYFRCFKSAEVASEDRSLLWVKMHSHL